MMTSFIAIGCKDNREKAVELRNRASALINTFDCDSMRMASSLLDQAIALDSTYAVAYNDKAVILIQTHNRNSLYKALNILDKAIGIDPSNTILYANKIQCHDYLGEKSKSIDCLLKYRESAKDNNMKMRCSISIASNNDILGNKEKADTYYKEALTYGTESVKNGSD